MTRITVALSAALLCLTGTASSTPTGIMEYDTDRARYRPGQEVVVTLANKGDGDWLLDEQLTIRRVHNDDLVATYVLSEEERTLEPGEKLAWLWDQRMGCYGSCQNVWEGEAAGPGNYAVVLGDSKDPLRAKFEIGEFFTLRFREIEGEFTVFVRRDVAIGQMRAEAEAKEKTLIVSGIVRNGANYNPDWSYKMGPGSIVLGEVFIEVCDASPHYVEDHRKQWMGQRWCPWSSYVERVGK